MPNCVIKIIDEVNCKIEGLDIATRRKCSNLLSFVLPFAYHMPAFKLGKWDGKVSFFSIGGVTQINLLDRVLPILEQANYEIDIVDHRQQYNFLFNEVDENIVSDRQWPESHSTHANKPIILKDHQVTVINNFLNNLQSIQVVATGGGKTITTGTLSKIVEEYGRTIIIVPSKQLVEQTLEDYLLLGLDAGVYYGDQKDWDKKHTICTWQSLERLLKKTKDGDVDEDGSITAFIKNVMAVIVDECHGVRADSLKKLLSGIFKNIPIRWGLTGTIPKQDYEQASLVGCLGPVIHGVQAHELQELGILSKCEIDIIQTQETAKFNNYQDETKFLTSNIKRLNWVSKFIDQISNDGNTLVLVNRIETGEELEKLISDSKFISGRVKVKDRKEEYDEVAKLNNKVLIATFGIAAVGINVPRIFNLVIIESGKSFIKVIQSIGRGLRKAEDKDFVKIYDICSATKYSKRHLTERKKFYKECQYPFAVHKITIE